MAQVSKVKALMDFFKAEPNSFKPDMQAIKAFKEACTPEEWNEYSNQAAAALGNTVKAG